MGVADRAQRTWKLPGSREVVTAFLALLLATISLKYLILDQVDRNKCKALMTEGQWYHDTTWLTPGCVSEPYDGGAINSCFEKRRIVLAGDASIQSIFWAIIEALDGSVERRGPVDEHLYYSNSNLELDYYWDPFMNGSELFANLDAYRANEHDVPALTVIGGGRWHVDSHAITEFKEAMDRMASVISPTDGQISIGKKPLSKTDGPGDLVLFVPVQEPYSEDPVNALELDSHRQMNAHLQQLADGGQIELLSNFNDMTRGRKEKFFDGGLAVDDNVSRRRRDVILGLRCNAKIAVQRSFPHTRTCCGTWKGPNWIQLSFLIVGLAILPAVVLLDLVLPLLKDQNRSVVRAFCAFTSAVSLQYITDRTHVFEQVTRLPLEPFNLYCMLVAILVIGFVSIKRCKSPKSTNQSGKSANQPFLPRDQSDEWKGWMQALIITYHYNKAWTAIWFWEIIRLAVSSYLFLTGFGHTVYFLQKKDYSLKRVAAVMIRTNLLPVALAYVMRTRWLLYYYMPLSSFWFLVVYTTLAVVPSFNASTPLLIGKIVVSAALVRAFISTPDLPQTVTRFFALTCKISFDANAFFDYRVRIDEYIVYVGMLAAIFYIWAKDAISLDNNQQALSRWFRRAFPWLQHLATAAAAIALPYFWYWVNKNFHAANDWTDYQPYIGCVPILSFLLLRNAHPSLRNFHSSTFAWLGRYSGEMYVMQDHLWLAGDQEAVLRTGFFHGNETLTRDRWRDLLVLTPLYLIMCCIIGDATGVIAGWFVQDIQPAPAQRVVAAPANSADELEMGLLAGASVNEDGEVMEVKSAPPDSVWVKARNRLRFETVRSRLIFVLACMWFLNMTYK